MITTGGPRSSATRKTEIVDVANGVTCSELADFPLEIDSAVSANLDGTPVVCGGAFNYPQRSAKCYRFTNFAWEVFASMKAERSNAAGVMYNKKLHIFGGWSTSDSKLKTSETIDVNGELIDGPDMPTSLAYHAMTMINDTVSILSGGWANSDPASTQTWYYNHVTEAFTSGPALLEGRNVHGSAINLDKVTKSKIVVVTGGHSTNVHGTNGHILGSTELLINGQWQTGTIQCRK